MPRHGWVYPQMGLHRDSQVAPGGRWLFTLYCMNTHHPSIKYSILYVFDLLESTIGTGGARFVGSVRLSCCWGKIRAFHRGPEPNMFSVLVVTQRFNK